MMGESGAESGKGGSGAADVQREIAKIGAAALKYTAEKNVLLLRVKKRFEHTRQYAIKKRVAEPVPNPVLKILSPLISRLTGKRGQ